MAEDRVQRRLAAILAADVVGYSRLMEQDETATLSALKARHKEILVPLIAQHQGRLVKMMGDGLLVEFASAVNAVACSLDLQKHMTAANDGLAEDRRIVFRIGISLGDVIVENGDLYGDGVNVAARLETIAQPGDILISGAAYDQVRNKVPASLEDVGARNLKNIAEPVRVYRVGGPPRSPIARPETGGSPSIAVLPFANMSGDVGQQYFSDGITEDITTELARFPQLHVAARNSSFRYRGQDIDIVRAGSELGVKYLVEGSVRRLGNRIRITAQLIDIRSGHHLWAERFDRGEEELFAVQDQVVRTIAATLVGRLQAAGLEQAKRKPPANLAAYECVLRGFALPVGDSVAEAEAQQLFQRAIELDPGYARAFDLAKEAARLDEHEANCQGTLGMLHMYRRSYELAEFYALKALALNPNSPALVANLGQIYVFVDKPAEGLERLREAKQLDPYFDPSWYWAYVGVAQFLAHQYDEAITCFGRATNSPFWVKTYLSVCCALAGRLEDAQDYAADVIRLIPSFSRSRFAAKEPFKRATDRQHLLDGLRKAQLPE